MTIVPTSSSWDRAGVELAAKQTATSKNAHSSIFMAALSTERARSGRNGPYAIRRSGAGQSRDLFDYKPRVEKRLVCPVQSFGQFRERLQPVGQRIRAAARDKRVPIGQPAAGTAR